MLIIDYTLIRITKMKKKLIIYIFGKSYAIISSCHLFDSSFNCQYLFYEKLMINNHFLQSRNKWNFKQKFNFYLKNHNMMNIDFWMNIEFEADKYRRFTCNLIYESNVLKNCWKFQKFRSWKFWNFESIGGLRHLKDLESFEKFKTFELFHFICTINSLSYPCSPNSDNIDDKNDKIDET